MTFSRREFMLSTAAFAGATMLPFAPAQAAKAKYTRYSATSDQGKAMLKSYAVAIEKMLKLPPDHPHNWFRNAFVHFMDCPHINWWFYVWHRGYLGFFEETVRRYSDNPNFAFPYWDWTETPRIPNEMFDGPLTPVDKAFLPYTKDLDTFTAYLKPSMQSYWNALNKAQRKQLDLRGFTTFDLLWDGVIGYDPSSGTTDLGNQAFATTDRSRYLSRDNPALDEKTTKACSKSTIKAGLSPTEFYSPNIANSFTSSKTVSHNVASNDPKASVLEGQPHNLVHNYIGGVGNWGQGPFGNMTNNLSPVDPVFFLHHANMDRLWDVWTRKQQEGGLPILPTDKTERAELVREPFLFFVRADGTYVVDGKAGDYLSTDRFHYDYAPGGYEGEDTKLLAARKTAPRAPVKGTVKGGVGSVTLTAAPTGPVVATVTVSRPVGAVRTFDVLVNAPAGVTQVEADSPYYAGTVGFFGPAMHGMAHDTTFAVPLPEQLHATAALNATNKQAPATLEIRLAPTYDKSAPAPAVKGVTVQSL